LYIRLVRVQCRFGIERQASGLDRPSLFDEIVVADRLPDVQIPRLAVNTACLVAGTLTAGDTVTAT